MPILEVVHGTRESTPELVGTAAALAATHDDEYLSVSPVDNVLFNRARALDAVARLLAGDALHEVVYEAVIGCGLRHEQVEAAFDIES